jgi:hypothetical protein
MAYPMECRRLAEPPLWGLKVGRQPLILVFIVQQVDHLGRKFSASCARLSGVEDAGVGQFAHEYRDLFSTQLRPCANAWSTGSLVFPRSSVLGCNGRDSRFLTRHLYSAKNSRSDAYQAVIVM